ncbi:chitinase-like protein PB1E7.04c isoform X2 [Alosa sapidissima]|uniref:chitinase-like protein PB1E7.04c isoform X2 n=1 Tax=Alosa sapidissima TaxID=34773 RepID=UPI001C0A33FA|nr:chitinase-like protein PB1E7.04c isoform X2 [Alosa sapidissima]
MISFPLLLFMVALSGRFTALHTLPTSTVPASTVPASAGCSTSTQVVQQAADIVFLLDGSRSVSPHQFLIMKTFVKNVTRSLLPYNTLFAFAQYSSELTKHVNFNQYHNRIFESQVNSIIQSRGGTYTAWAMKKVVQEMFDSSVGARAGAKRFLIVITDGLTSGSASYTSVAAQADASNITRYAIGVGGAWSSQSSQNELKSIASKPDSEHVFPVTNFEGLTHIRESLEKKILTIQGHPCSTVPFTVPASTVPFTTFSTVPPSTASTVRSSTVRSSTSSTVPSSTVPPSTASTVPSSTVPASTVPSSTASAVPASAVPTSTSSAVPTSAVPSSTVPPSTASAVPASAVPSSAVPTSTASAVPTSTASAVPTSTASAVPTSTASAVPPSTASTVPASTVPSSTVPSSTVTTSTASTVTTSTASTVPSSTVPPSTASTVPSSTVPSSTVPSSTVPTSTVRSSTSSAVPTSAVPASTASAVPSSVPTSTASAVPSSVPSSTASAVPSSTSSTVPSSTASTVPASTGCSMFTQVVQQVPADIVFLLDGSTSVKADQFILMKEFVKNVTRSLLPYDTLFAFAQYSHQMTIHVNFNQFNRKGFEKQVDSIVQRQGGTYTGNAVGKVVKYMFHSFAGARSGAKRILIVITDGLTSGSASYTSVAAQADASNITRYAIGVGGAWSSQSSQNELKSIASKPDSEHVFPVTNFEGLTHIRESLEKKILTIQGHPCSTVPSTVPSSTVPSSTVRSSTVPASTVPPSTASTVPSSTVPASTVPFTTFSTVPPSTASTVPSSTFSTVPSSTSSAVPSSTVPASTVPFTTFSTVPASTVPASTASAVPSSVPSSTASAVPSSTSSTVPSSTASTVPASTGCSMFTQVVQQGVVGNCSYQGNQTCLPTSSNLLTTTQVPADIVFLLDGSTSVKADQFILMKEFVKNVTRSLLPYDTLFAFAQYSHQMTIHVNFNQFNRKGFEKQVDSIVQRQGGTYTGNAVGKVVKYRFHSFVGARPGAKRILIIITDGQTYDSSKYPSVTAEADGQKITRYAIVVGSAWTSQTARNQLNAIASKPKSDHVFEVDNFDALNNIRKALENQLLNIQGLPTVNRDAGGAACVFPFVYLGTLHWTCTTINHNKPWCSTTGNFDQDGQGGECCVEAGQQYNTVLIKH